MFTLSEEHLFGPDKYDLDSEWFALDLELDRWLKSREAADFLAKLSAQPSLIDETPELADPIDAFFAGKLARLRQRIAQLNELIAVRSKLQAESLSQIDYQISVAAQSLAEFHSWGVGYNQGVDMKRNHLERQLAIFRRERRDSRLKTWQDLAGLRRELNEAVTEYQELFRRYRVTESKG